MMRRQQDQQSGVLYELSSLVLNILRSPPSPIPFSDQLPEMPPTRRLSPTSSSSAASQISPAGFASLLLGISLALMLCGSVTFFIGFILMPWVLGLVMVFYVAGIVSSLSMLGRSIFCYAMGPSQPRKEIPGNMESIVKRMRRVIGGIKCFVKSRAAHRICCCG
ncbi:hypothetical protein CsatB_022663 [Cannabis sativa]